MAIDMQDDIRAIWPFPVLPDDQLTELHKRQLDFLETAHREGYIAYMFLSSSFGAEAKCGRRGEIVHRGLNRRWEICLYPKNPDDTDSEVQPKVTGDFTEAADEVLRWLRAGLHLCN